MKIVMIFLILMTITSCGSTVKTKQDCVSECQERGAEYVGIVPKGIKMGGIGGPSHDVCQCK